MKHELFLMPLIKFIAMMTTLLVMNWHLGYRYMLMRWILVIFVSLACGLLPWTGITAVAAFYLLGHVSALTWEGAAVLLFLMLGAVLMHYLFLPGGSVIVLLLPLAFYLKVPYLVPIVAGLFGSALTIIPVAEGVILYFFMIGLEKNAAVFSDPAGSMVTNLQAIARSMTGQQMFLTLIVFVLAALAVYGIAQLRADYAYPLAAVVGGVLILIAMLMGSFFLEMNLSRGGLIFSSLICTVIACVVAVWGHALDYASVEFLKYEDDDYVYYVKAVPKLKLAKEERVVYEISDDEPEYYGDEYYEDEYLPDEE